MGVVKLLFTAVVSFWVSLAMAIMNILIGKNKKGRVPTDKERSQLEDCTTAVCKATGGAFLTMKQSYIDIPQTSQTLYVVSFGDPSNPLCVCLHGFPDCWLDYRTLIPFLVEKCNFYVVVPHLRGYIGSSKPNAMKDYNLQNLTNDVHGLAEHYLAQCKQDKFRLIAHDWGVPIAFEYAHQHENRLASLTLLNGPVWEKYSGLVLSSNPSQLLRGWYVIFFQLPSPIPDALLTSNPDGVLPTMFREKLSPEVLDLYRLAWRGEGRMTAMMNYYRAALRCMLFGAKGGPVAWEKPLQLPVLVVWGMKDAALEQSNVEIQKWAANLTVHKIEKAKHWVHIDAQEECIQALEKHLVC
eukprot:TRINITY_DN114289_c0_g1_i1.p1 TRINITY_DN114289_c0_g1~~TRINITY_DN114289_c0_g1_i1.p1  ORF type:complete len:362 (+),score=29.95 TRINITY_DN114289_c0_g1_i1:25-1086(+)